MARKQPSFWRQIAGHALRSNKLSALAVVLLCVSLGAVTVPTMLAATVTKPVVTSMKATPSNTAAYSFALAWSGTTTDHWRGEYYKGSTLVSAWDTTAKSKTLSGLQCGITYSFRIAAAGPQYAVLTPYKSVSAVTRCPSVSWNSFVASGNNVTARWSNTAGFTETYKLYVKTGNGPYGATSVSSSSIVIGSACGTTYSAYLIPTAGGQSGSATGVDSATTAACPVAPAPTPTPVKVTPAPPKKSTPASKTTTPTPAATPAPATPGDFSAVIDSQKVVQLEWDSVSGADHYLLQRSTDNATWQQLNTTSGTTYSDSTTDFATTYYYQLQAIGTDGQASTPSVTQATTDAFVSSPATVSSADKLVSVHVPSGAIAGTYNCSLTIGDLSKYTTVNGQRTLVGPYRLLCVTDSGDIVTSFKHPVAVTLNLASVGNGYHDFTAATSSGNSWAGQKTSYNASKQQLSFTLTSAKTFAAFGTKKSNLIGVILLILLLLIVLAAAIVGFIFLRRRRSPAQQETAAAALSAEQEFQRALAQPNCTHLGMARQVMPSSQGCYECEQQDTHWTNLRICLICGHVGCSDDSPQQHTFKHFQETGHPLVYDYADPSGNSIGWCYIDQTYI